MKIQHLMMSITIGMAAFTAMLMVQSPNYAALTTMVIFICMGAYCYAVETQSVAGLDVIAWTMLLSYICLYVTADSIFCTNGGHLHPARLWCECPDMWSGATCRD